jgi:hypothetical protein
MTVRRPLLQLPLLVAGITAPTEELLRMVGVPVVTCNAEIAAEVLAETDGCRFLITDSRLPHGLRGLRTAASQQQTIDLASLAAGEAKATAADVPELEIIRSLKARIEELGGVWLRISEWPYPYQHAVCEQQSAAPVSELTWHTQGDVLRRWLHARQRLTVCVQQIDMEYRIDCQGLDDSWVPTLELWRGSHVATIPLSGPQLRIPTDGLIYVHDVIDRRAGFPTEAIMRLFANLDRTVVYRQSA